jgi:hypothetical protein
MYNYLCAKYHAVEASRGRGINETALDEDKRLFASSSRVNPRKRVIGNPLTTSRVICRTSLATAIIIIIIILISHFSAFSWETFTYPGI